jgi:hypothetical protein
MKIRPFGSGEGGSVSLVILAILFLVAALVMGNSRPLFQLNRELRLIEKEQLKKYPGTNSNVLISQ